MQGNIFLPPSADGKRSVSVSYSLDCPNCGQVDDLETVNPTGISFGLVVLWNCGCGNTRAIELSESPPQELIRKAILADDMRKRSVGWR